MECWWRLWGLLFLNGRRIHETNSWDELIIISLSTAGIYFTIKKYRYKGLSAWQKGDNDVKENKNYCRLFDRDYLHSFGMREKRKGA